MLKLIFAVPPLLFLALLPQGSVTPAQDTAPAQAAAAAQAAAPDDTVPPEPPAGHSSPVPETNPVKPTAESQAHAKEMYAINCAMCHGANGDGKGDLVADMKLNMKDLHDPATLEGMTDSAIYKLIRDGKGKMLAEGDRAKPDEIWNLVILVRSYSKK